MHAPETTEEGLVGGRRNAVVFLGRDGRIYNTSVDRSTEREREWNGELFLAIYVHAERTATETGTLSGGLGALLTNACQ